MRNSLRHCEEAAGRSGNDASYVTPRNGTAQKRHSEKISQESTKESLSCRQCLPMAMLGRNRNGNLAIIPLPFRTLYGIAAGHAARKTL